VLPIHVQDWLDRCYTTTTQESTIFQGKPLPEIEEEGTRKKRKGDTEEDTHDKNIRSIKAKQMLMTLTIEEIIHARTTGKTPTPWVLLTSLLLKLGGLAQSAFGFTSSLRRSYSAAATLEMLKQLASELVEYTRKKVDSWREKGLDWPWVVMVIYDNYNKLQLKKEMRAGDTFVNNVDSLTWMATVLPANALSRQDRAQRGIPKLTQNIVPPKLAVVQFVKADPLSGSSAGWGCRRSSSGETPGGSHCCCNRGILQDQRNRPGGGEEARG
jgi:hypothetical protein